MHLKISQPVHTPKTLMLSVTSVCMYVCMLAGNSNYRPCRGTGG